MNVSIEVYQEAHGRVGTAVCVSVMGVGDYAERAVEAIPNPNNRLYTDVHRALRAALNESEFAEDGTP